MKSALILSLALAANGQVDNEFASTYNPSNPSGAELVRNTGWGRSLPFGHRTPIDYNTQYLNKYGLKHDDIADKELMFYNDRSGRRLIFPNFEIKVQDSKVFAKDDEADDELMQFYTYTASGVKIPVPASQLNPLSTKKNFHENFFFIEFCYFYSSFTFLSILTLIGSFIKSQRLPTFICKESSSPYSNSKVQNFYDINIDIFCPQRVNRPMDQRGNILLPSTYDDELAYLGHLIKHAQNEKAAVHTFDDDELRFEKKGQEKTHEKPEFRRKFRPVEMN